MKNSMKVKVVPQLKKIVVIESLTFLDCVSPKILRKIPSEDIHYILKKMQHKKTFYNNNNALYLESKISCQVIVKCDGKDTFNEEKGIKIAKAKLNYKMASKRSRVLNSFLDIYRELVFERLGFIKNKKYKTVDHFYNCQETYIKLAQ